MSKIYASAPRAVNAIIAQTNRALFSDRFSSRVGVYVASDAQYVEFGLGRKKWFGRLAEIHRSGPIMARRGMIIRGSTSER